MGGITGLIRQRVALRFPELFKKFSAGGVQINERRLLFHRNFFHRVRVGKQSVGELAISIERPAAHLAKEPGIQRPKMDLLEIVLIPLTHKKAFLV